MRTVGLACSSSETNRRPTPASSPSSRWEKPPAFRRRGQTRRYACRIPGSWSPHYDREMLPIGSIMPSSDLKMPPHPLKRPMCSRSGAQASAKYGKMAEQCQVLLQQNLTLYPHRLAMRRMGVVITANNAANTLARRLCAQHHDHEQHDVHHGEQQHHDRRCRRRYHGRHHLYRRRRRRNRRRQPPPPWPPKRGTLRVPSLPSERWPNLPPHIREAVLALVDAADASSRDSSNRGGAQLTMAAIVLASRL